MKTDMGKTKYSGGGVTVPHRPPQIPQLPWESIRVSAVVRIWRHAGGKKKPPSVQLNRLRCLSFPYSFVFLRRILDHTTAQFQHTMYQVLTYTETVSETPQIGIIYKKSFVPHHLWSSHTNDTTRASNKPHHNTGTAHINTSRWTGPIK